MLVLGVMFLEKAEMVTGGVAGLALLITRFVPVPAGAMFFIINIPLLVFAFIAMGRAFALKTILLNMMILLLALVAGHLLFIQQVDPAFAAIAGGTLIGTGILMGARHRASAGGAGIIALYLQEKRGMNAGRILMMADATVLAISLPFLGLTQFLWSILSAIAANIVMMVWHKPGRYAGY